MAALLCVLLEGCGWSGTSPALSVQPLSQTVTSGQTVTFSAVATGSPPLAYQWFREGSPIPGATGPSYSIAKADLADSGAQYELGVTNPGGTARSADATLTVNPIVPQLVLAPVPQKTYGSAPFAVSATSSSPAPITYAVSSGPARLSDSLVDVTGTGAVVVSATQSPIGEFAGTTSTTMFSVAPAMPTLNFAPVTGKTFGDAPFSVNASSSSTGALTYAVTSGPATVSGSTVTITGAGRVVLAASQAADPDYLPATASTSFTVGPEKPTLAFAPVAGKTYGDASFSVSASSASAGAISFAVTSGPATISGSEVTITGAGTVTLSASQAADANYLAAQTTTVFTVAPGAATLAFTPVGTRTFGDASFPVSASSASTGAVTYAITSGPASISGSTVTITGAGTVVLSASQAADANYVAGTASTSFTVNPAPPTSAALSASSLDFGQVVIGSAAASKPITVSNTGLATLYLSPSVSGDQSYSIASAQGCGTTLAPGASCTVTALYAPTSASGGTPQTATLNLNFENAGASPQSVALTGVSGALSGSVTNTNHPQVANYLVDLPFPGSVTVNFGPTTAYGRQTWTKTLSAPGTVNIFVAGMLADTTYHMQASVQFADGSTAVDVDHTFQTGTVPFPISVTTETPSSLTPQPGVEQLSINNGAYFGLVVTDLEGRTLWSYVTPGDYGGLNLEGAKLMSNGDFLVTLGQGSSYPLNGTSLTNIVAVREIDLGGNTVREITAGTLSQKLQAAGYNITLQQFHHDVVALPNGHWLVLSNETRSFTNLTGLPGTTAVLGDVVIDLDENLNPVWVWDEFDHLDVNRHPWNFPDWTHTNALVYSPDDGNLIISMRHQNWVVKVDYRNGTGSGNVLWHLGQGGDFTLLNGTDPTDWNYAQHFPSLFSPNSAGVFSLGMMNNGDDRQFPTGVQCDTSGQPACLYTSIPVFQIDESAMTAKLTYNQNLAPSLYSYFGGNTELLGNGDIEYDLAGTNTTMADIFEVTPGATPATVWHMHSASNIYRGYRIPSLYPGVQW